MQKMKFKVEIIGEVDLDELKDALLGEVCSKLHNFFACDVTCEETEKGSEVEIYIAPLSNEKPVCLRKHFIDAMVKDVIEENFNVDANVIGFYLDENGEQLSSDFTVNDLQVTIKEVGEKLKIEADIIEEFLHSSKVQCFISEWMKYSEEDEDSNKHGFQYFCFLLLEYTLFST